MRTERSFLDGKAGSPGIKALLDQHTSMEVLTKGYKTALENMDACVAVLKVAVSPATVGFTAFTIIAREGMEAIIILTALLAGLRGNENRATRRWVSSGALFGVALSLLTFWLSQTIVQSLVHYGEKLEAVVSILAVIILFMVTNWVFHKFYWVEWNAQTA
jgi:high-affinity iron transporter